MANQTFEIPVSTLQYPVYGSVNVNSLVSKHSMIETLLSESKMAVLAIQETKLASSVTNNSVSIAGYRIFRQDRRRNGRNGGGVCLYVRENLKPKRIKNFQSELEICAVETLFQNRKIRVVSIYRSPTDHMTQQDMENFADDFSDALSQISVNQSIETVIMGDINIDYLNQREFQHLSPILDQFALEAKITAVTHRNKCIDHIFLSSSLPFVTSGLAPPIEANHCVVWVRLKLLSERVPAKTFVHWDWSSADIERAKFMLLFKDEPNLQERDICQEMENSCDSANSAAEYLTNAIYHVQCVTVEHHEVKTRHNTCPWMTPEVRTQLSRKKSSFKAFRENPTPKNEKKWKKESKKARKMVRNAKSTAIESKFDDVIDLRSFWKTVRNLNGGNNSDIPEIRDGTDQILVSDAEKCEAFSTHFHESFTPPAGPETHFNLVNLGHEELRCTEFEVHQFIKRLKCNTAAGFDGISPRFIKKLIHELKGPIAHVLNLCAREHSFPDCWKYARVTPVAKIPSPESVKDFRPISVLPALSKLAEMWLRDRLSVYIDPKLSSNQFAYSHGRSTEDAIATVQQLISAGFMACPGETKVAVLSLDCSKAFDSIPHTDLIQSLINEFDVPLSLAAIVKSYLKNRFQAIKVNSTISAPKPVLSGTAQGSLVGPKFFISFVNPVLDCEISSLTKSVAYADDFVLVSPIRNHADLERFQNDVNTIVDAFNRKCLKLNPNKSKLLVCTVAPYPRTVGNEISIEINGTEVQRVDTLKYLGVILDPALNMALQANTASIKAKRALGAINHSLGGQRINRNVLSRIYLHKILPILLYALPVISPASKFSWIRLEKMQWFAARLITNDFSASYVELLERLKWKSISEICLARQLLLVYKYANGSRHLSLGILQMREPIRNTRHNNSDRTAILEWNSRTFLSGRENPRTGLRMEQAPIFTLLRVWNMLPSTFNGCKLNDLSLPLFKNLVKETRFYAHLCQSVAITSNVPPLKQYYLEL